MKKISKTDTTSASSVAVTKKSEENTVHDEENASEKTEAVTAAVTEPAEEEIILIPIPSDEPFEIPACDIIEDIATAEEKFADKEIIKRAKEICFEAAHKNIEYYNDTVEKVNKIETAEDIAFSCGMAFDFDGDGSDEYCLAFDFRPQDPIGGSALVLIDGDECMVDITDSGDTAITDMNLILSGGIYFPMVICNGSSRELANIYGFEKNEPQAIGSGGPYNILYKDNIFFRIGKYGQIYEPFVLCSDGIFRQLGREKISREDFEKHVENGGAYLDRLAEKGEAITEIYTYGYYNYELYNGNFCYDLYGNNFADDDTFLTKKTNRIEAPAEDRYFTDEVIYGDVWAAKPVRSPDEDTAAKLLDRFYDFYYSIQDFKIPCHTDEENIKYYTEEDIMNGLCEFCTKKAAEELFNTAAHQLYIKDGRYYSRDEVPSFFLPTAILKIQKKRTALSPQSFFPVPSDMMYRLSCIRGLMQNLHLRTEYGRYQSCPKIFMPNK